MKQKLAIIVILLFIVISIAACSKEADNLLDSTGKIESQNDGKIIDESVKESIKETVEESKDELDDEFEDKQVVNEEEASVEPVRETNNSEDGVVVTNEANEAETSINTIRLEAPPFQYYISEKAKETITEKKPIKLNVVLSKPNQITDDELWFVNNNLTLNTYLGVNGPVTNNGENPSNNNDFWENLYATKVIYDDSYIYCIYGAYYDEGYILNIYDSKTMKLVYSLDFLNYKYTPEYIAEEYDFIQQNINWAAIEEDVLYVSYSHNTYAKSSNYMNAFITAIDLSSMEIIWNTDALVSNSYNFLIINDTIICGYGFTNEEDFLYQINISSGEVQDKIPLKSAPSYIIKKDNTLFVRTYNMDYELKIMQ